MTAAKNQNTQVRVKENKLERVVRNRETLSKTKKLLNAIHGDEQWMKSDIQTNIEHNLKIKKRCAKSSTSIQQTTNEHLISISTLNLVVTGLGCGMCEIFSLRIPSPFSWAAALSTHCSLRLPEKHPRNSTPFLGDRLDSYQVQHLYVKKRQRWRSQDDHQY